MTQGKRKGTYTHNYDPVRLRQLIKAKKDAKEIMKEVQISRYSLYEQLLMLQEEDNELYEIPGLLDPPTLEEKRWWKYKKDGVIFSEKMLQYTGFKPGDAFEMIVEEDRVILKKI